MASQATKRNKANLRNLASRVRRLLNFLLLEPEPRDEAEAERRTGLAQCVFIFESYSTSGDVARSEVSKTSRAN